MKAAISPQSDRSSSPTEPAPLLHDFLYDLGGGLLWLSGARLEPSSALPPLLPSTSSQLTPLEAGTVMALTSLPFPTSTAVSSPITSFLDNCNSIFLSSTNHNGCRPTDPHAGRGGQPSPAQPPMSVEPHHPITSCILDPLYDRC